MNVAIVDFVQRVKDGRASSYELPDNREMLATILASLDPATSREAAAFLAVWRWIANALGDQDVHMHDMIAFPIQFAQPHNKQWFRQLGFSMDETFDRDTSLQVMQLLFDKLPVDFDDEQWTYLSLVLNVTMRLKAGARTNIVTEAWDKEGVIVLQYHVESSSIGDVLSVLRTAASNEEVTGERFEDWAFALMTVTDPMLLLKHLASQFGDTPEEQSRLERLRERLVLRRWGSGDSDIPGVPDYGGYLLDMIAFERDIRLRGDPDMLSMFADVVNGVSGRAAVVIPQILSADLANYAKGDTSLDTSLDALFASSFVPDRLVFAGIEINDPKWTIHTVAKFELIFGAIKGVDRHTAGNVYLEHAMQIWRRRHDADHAFKPHWGEYLLFEVLDDDDDARLSIITANSPGGKIPTAWINGALEYAAFNESDETSYVRVVGKLARYGMINPETHKIPYGEGGISLVELVALANGGLDQMETRFKYVLRKGAPHPSRDTLSTWTPDAQVTFRSVTGALHGLFNAR